MIYSILGIKLPVSRKREKEANNNIEETEPGIQTSGVLSDENSSDNDINHRTMERIQKDMELNLHKPLHKLWHYTCLILKSDAQKAYITFLKQYDISVKSGEERRTGQE